MVILLGATSSKHYLDIFKQKNLGRMITPDRNVSPYENEIYAVDNGAFGCWKKGIKFDELSFYKTIERLCNYHKPLFGVIPDIVGEGDKSLDFSLSWIDRLPDWPWYLAVQDGMDSALVVEVIDLVDGLFLGGTDSFKKTAPFWAKIAHHHFKKFHYGRAGTYSKLQHAYQSDADSLDSSFPLWTTARLKEFLKWIEKKPWGKSLFPLSELQMGY